MARRIGNVRRLYSGRQAVTMLIAIAIGASAVWHANRVLAVNEPPAVATEPVLSLVLDSGRRLGWVRDADYQVFETISGCHNPASVELDALVRGDETPGPDLTQAGYVHGALSDPLGRLGVLTLLENTPTSFPQHWVRARHLTVRRARREVVFGAPLRTWYPASVRVGMAEASLVRAVLVKVRFQADWVLPRSSGTCFVRFPTLQMPRIDPLDPPSQPFNPPAPGPGEVQVTSTGGETVNAQSSIPPPNDPRIPEWRCASTAVAIAQESSPTGGSGNCGGVAVFAEPGAEAHVALWLLIDGALVGVAAALFVESAVKFRWPLIDVATERGGRGA
jgi:hypothetical protein